MPVLTFLLLLGLFGWLIHRFGTDSNSTPDGVIGLTARINELSELNIQLSRTIRTLKTTKVVLEALPNPPAAELEQLEIQILGCKAQQQTVQAKLTELGVSSSVIHSVDQ